MNDSVNQVTEGNIPFQSAVLQLSPSQVTMMSLASQSNYQPLKMARLCRISLRQLERMFKVESGCTPRQWLRTQRLNNALLLLRKAQSVKQVGYSLAYAQIPQFCREFKMRFGITPAQFRQSQAQTQDKIVTAYLGREQEIGPCHPLRRIISSGQFVLHTAA
jgi:AraC-like DNA-binding protein